MKAISIKQPWASLIIEGIKDIENRSWYTHYRGRLYIHASKGYDRQGADLVSKLYPEHESIIKDASEIRGGIIGHVHLVDCVTSHNSPWFHGEYGFVLTSFKEIPFYPIKGQLGLFDFFFENRDIVLRKEVQLSLF